MFEKHARLAGRDEFEGVFRTAQDLTFLLVDEYAPIHEDSIWCLRPVHTTVLSLPRGTYGVVGLDEHEDTFLVSITKRRIVINHHLDLQDLQSLQGKGVLKWLKPPS